ncbi:MAG: nitrate reductase cytochrome c-type subunit [Gammaproteobacteria bacterium]
MKTTPFFSMFCMIFTFTGCIAGNATKEMNMGLSKDSVFDTPTPTAYDYSDAKPGKNEWLPRAWEGIPPQIPHRTEMYLPVVTADNQCLDCHDTPKYIGKPKNMDRTIKNKSPMSRQHYTDDTLDTMAGARFNCMQCHVPQSNAAPLVESTFQ